MNIFQWFQGLVLKVDNRGKKELKLVVKMNNPLEVKINKKKKGERMMKSPRIFINLSEGVAYKSQRVNKRNPHSSCNVTSYSMGLYITGFARNINYSKDQSLADYLTTFFESDFMRDYQKQCAPWSVGQFPPQQVHACLEYGINYLVDDTIVKFSTKTKKSDIIQSIIDGKPVILSGDFPCLDKHNRIITIGHIIIAVGLIEQPDGTFDFIIDDPYGDYRTQYRNTKGNDIIMTNKDFDRIVRKSSDGFWAHTFLKVHPEGKILGG